MNLTEVEVEKRPYSPEWFEEVRRQLGDIVCRQLGIYAVADDILLSVVIPIYNEKDSFKVLLDRVKAVPIRKEIVLIDDCSKDGTRDQLKELEAELAQSPPDELNKLVFAYH